MPFDSLGNFSRLHSWEDDRINDIEIASDRHDEEDDGFADALSNCVCKDGRTVMTGALKMGNLQIKQLAAGAANTDAVNKKQIDDLSADLRDAFKDLADELWHIGDIKASVLAQNHDNWFLCNGQAVSRTTYADLFELIGTDFGEGDGVTTFNLPDYRGKFLRGLGGNSASDIYTTQAEGLPNITGSSQAQDGYVRSSHAQSGAISALHEVQGSSRSGDGGNTAAYFDFDASLSNPIYGASEHVTPINQAVNYFIKVKAEA